MDPQARPGAETPLLALARKGDERAFADLFDRHAGTLAARIRGGLSARITRKVSVSDILQEVRITAFRRIGTLERGDEGAFGAWLLRIADYKVAAVVKRYAQTAKRAARAEVTRGERPATVDARAGGRSPSEAAMGREDAAFVRDVLALLPEDYRRILSLVFEEQLSLGEAAERMGRSREAAKKLYGRALARFTELVERARGSSHE